MKWTRERPTEPGFYWRRLRPLDPFPEVVEIQHYNGVLEGLIVLRVNYEDEPYLSDTKFDGNEWAGPVPLPAD